MGGRGVAGGLGLSSQGRSSSKNVRGACLILWPRGRRCSLKHECFFKEIQYIAGNLVLTLKMSAFFTLFTFSTQLLTLNYLLYSDN